MSVGLQRIHHNCGYIEADILIQRLLQKCCIDLASNHTQCKFVHSICDEYIQDDSEYVCWLFNQDLKVMPSTTFIHGRGPLIMTYRNHDGGTYKLYLHPPQSLNHTLPSITGDQLCHAVITPRTI